MPPGSERVEVGGYYLDPKNPPSILVQRKSNDKGWHRLKHGARVSTEDRLMSLPGYASELRLDNGVHLLLRGHVREFSLPAFSLMDYLQESAVVLHKNRDVDVDVTLERGRLYLSNHKDKGPAVVRLRFEKQVWDLTLEEPGSEVVLDLLRRSQEKIASSPDPEPRVTLFLLVLQGKASLAVEHNNFTDLSRTGPAVFQWDNQDSRVRGPGRADEKTRAPFAKVLPASGPEAAAMELALKQLSQRMLPDKPPTVALEEVLQTEPSMLHQLAIYCIGALDQPRKLLGILSDPDPKRALDRDTAIVTLRRWLGRSATHGRLLLDEKNNAGILLESPGYTKRQAEALFALLHNFSAEDRAKPETYELLAHYLLSDKVAIAELAHWHLYRLLSSAGVKIPRLDRFDAAAPRAEREKTADEIKKLIAAGQLPSSPSSLPSRKR